MRKAAVYVDKTLAGILEESESGKYSFEYEPNYQGQPVSLTMPITKRHYAYDHFPAFFEGLLPEGMILEALLRRYKLDRHDYFGQLLQVGSDVVGAVSVRPMT